MNKRNDGRPGNASVRDQRWGCGDTWEPSEPLGVAGESFGELPVTFLRLNRIRDQTSETTGFYGYSVDGLARAMSVAGLHEMLGVSAG